MLENGHKKPFDFSIFALAAKGRNNPIDLIGYKNHSDFIGI